MNNLFKTALMARHADRAITPIFASTSALGALVGALLLTRITTTPIHSYTLATHTFHITPIKLVIAVLMLAFAVLELTPATQRWGLPRKHLWIGGLTSGFFGGLSGHQGALRSAFLIRTDMPKEALVGTRAVCALAVDVTRLAVYTAAAILAARATSPTQEARDTLRTLHEHNTWPLIATGCAAALAGSLLGKRLLKETTITTIRATVAVTLIALSLALAAGLV